jgi:hypothetical protein
VSTPLLWLAQHPAAALFGLAVVLAVCAAAIVGLTRWGGGR